MVQCDQLKELTKNKITKFFTEGKYMTCEFFLSDNHSYNVYISYEKDYYNSRSTWL